MARHNKYKEWERRKRKKKKEKGWLWEELASCICSFHMEKRTKTN